jgi:hypothetical protein
MSAWDRVRGRIWTAGRMSPEEQRTFLEHVEAETEFIEQYEGAAAQAREAATPPTPDPPAWQMLWPYPDAWEARDRYDRGLAPLNQSQGLMFAYWDQGADVEPSRDLEAEA